MPNPKPPAWTPITLTGNAGRGTGILNNLLYVGQRPYSKQTYRKNPDTGRRHAFINPEDEQANIAAVLDLRIVSASCGRRKDRQAVLARGSGAEPATTPALPFFAQQRPKYLLTGKMTCGECGASYAKSGKEPLRLSDLGQEGIDLVLQPADGSPGRARCACLVRACGSNTARRHAGRVSRRV